MDEEVWTAVAEARAQAAPEKLRRLRVEGLASDDDDQDNSNSARPEPPPLHPSAGHTPLRARRSNTASVSSRTVEVMGSDADDSNDDEEDDASVVDGETAPSSPCTPELLVSPCDTGWSVKNVEDGLEP